MEGLDVETFCMNQQVLVRVELSMWQLQD